MPDDIHRPHRIAGRAMMRCVIAMTIALGPVVTAAAAGDDRPPPMPTPPPTADMPDEESIRPGLAPLLREGSQIQNARGTLREHTATATWRFTISPQDDADHQTLRHEFIMLPNAHLSEMKQVSRSMPDRIAVFQITAEVFVYDGRNYMLVNFPPRVISEQAAPRQPETEEPDTDSARSPSAAEIMRDLERDAGPVGRSPAAAARERQREQVTRTKDDRLLPENSSIQLRRGRISRDSGGAWKFIFDADASGQADPPMTLMPCLLLERIERYARRAGSNAPVLISGRVFVYGGRNYLLPTVFQIPRERSVLKP